SADIAGAPGSNACAGKILPSTVGPQFTPVPDPGIFPPEGVSLRCAATPAATTCSNGSACKRSSCEPLNPSSARTPAASFDETSGMACLIEDPLCTIARWNNTFDDGIAISTPTFPPPPDCPKIVTFEGSPPKLA